MIRHSLLWPTISLAAALGAFFSVRGALPGPPPPVTLSHQDAGKSGGAPQPATPAGEEDPLLWRIRFLEALEKADPASLREMFQSETTPRREKRAVAQRWAETDAEGLFDFLKGLSRTAWDQDGEQFEAVRGILFRTWALRNADAALTAAGSLSNRPQFRAARWEVVQTLFTSDPVKAFESAAKLQMMPGGDRLVDSVWKKDPAAFLKAAGNAPAGAFKNPEIHDAVDNAFGELVKQNPGAAAEWLKTRPPEQQGKLWERMACRFAEVDPAGAQAWFKETPPSAQREKAGAEMIKALAKKDPDAALEWLQDNLEGGRTAGFFHLAGAMAEKGVDFAKQLLEAMPAGAPRDLVVTAIAQNWAKKEFKPAMAWVLSLPADDPGRAGTIAQLGYQWTRNDLPGAAAFFRDQASEMERGYLEPNLIQAFSAKDLAGGLAWADSLSPPVKNQAYSRFYEVALQENKIPEVIAAVEKLPAAQQEAVAGMIAGSVMGSRYNDPVEDARLVNSLKQIPQHLRQSARAAIEKNGFVNGFVNPSRKEAALEALK